MEQIQCKMSSKKYYVKNIFKKRIINWFWKSLESVSFQLLREKGEAEVIIVIIIHNLILYLGLVKLTFQSRPSKTSLLCILLNKYGRINKPQTIIYCASSKELGL